jgi:hypothetical protein
MKKIGNFIMIAVFLIIGLKSCMISVISFHDLIIVERYEENGQYDLVIFTKGNEMIYIKQYEEIVEYGIYKIKGLEATHYISGIYCIGTFPFGLRFYKNAEKVYDAELVLSEKDGDSFPSVGESFKSTIIIYPDKVKIRKLVYEKLSPTESEIVEFENMIIDLKSL